MVMPQLMLPCLQYSQVPKMPVKMKLNRDVAMAAWVVPEGAQGGDQQDATHADSSNKPADDQGDDEKKDDHDLLRCDVVHKLSKQRAKDKIFYNILFLFYFI